MKPITSDDGVWKGTEQITEMKRDEYGDPVGGQRSLRNRKQRILHQILLMNNIQHQLAEGESCIWYY